MNVKRVDLTGKKFGRLTVIEKREPNKKRKTSMWLCRCECGNEKIIASHDLKHGTLSCGCMLKENRESFKNKYRNGKKINAKNTRILRIYNHMKQRCYNSNNSGYKNYGGRGITICKEWLENYYEFEKWSLENGYEDNLTIDRIDTNKGYSPKNCRWATYKQQANNERRNHVLEIDGIKHTVQEWSEIYKIKPNTIIYRIKRGWNVKRAVKEPVKSRR